MYALFISEDVKLICEDALADCGKLRDVYFESDLPTLEKDNQIVDIDPFTVFGLFNKSSMKESNKIKIIQKLLDMLLEKLWIN